MNGFEERLGRLLKAAAGEPPRAVDAVSVRARGRRQQRRLRLGAGAAAAIVAAAAIAIPLAVTGSHRRALTVVDRGSSPTVIAAPSEQLHNGQTIEVSLQGFPARQTVGIAECPSFRIPPGVGCGRAPSQTVLTTNARGAATGTLAVQFASVAFLRLFGQPKCGPTCLLVATSKAEPSVSATTVLSFATLPTTPPPPTRTAEPPGFEVTAASFVTADRGWALGSTGCPGCAGVATTDDGGRTWNYLPTPPASLYWYYRETSAVTDIDFANASDGYLFAPGLYATDDGGRTWTDQHLTGIKSLTVAGGYAYALTGYNGDGPETLYRSRLASNTWQKVQLPTAPARGQGFETAASGSDLVLLETGVSLATSPSQVGRLWVSSDAGTSWHQRRMPCTVADGGASVLSVARGHPRAWLLVCFDSRQSSQAVDTLQHIYGTSNGGNSWVRLADPPQHNAPTLLADNGSGHAFLATEGGAGDTLNGTFDGGGTWSTVIRDGGSFSGWADLGFVSSGTGYVVGPSHGDSVGPDNLYRTTDGGRTWRIIDVTP